MPVRSETTDIPGNRSLSDSERNERVAGIYTPFCAAVSALLRKRAAQGMATVLVTIHSFTPVYFGKPRAVEIGILNDTDTRLADAMLAQATDLPHRTVLSNEPYGPEDGVTHSLQIHGITHGLANVMIEIRNDLIRGIDGQTQMAQEVLTLLRPALSAMDNEVKRHA